jgi:hypothetical protein
LRRQSLGVAHPSLTPKPPVPLPQIRDLRGRDAVGIGALDYPMPRGNGGSKPPPYNKKAPTDVGGMAGGKGVDRGEGEPPNARSARIVP